ncbi:MAG: flippase activity-associated protein Agl23 [Chloroflexota bacterium]
MDNKRSWLDRPLIPGLPGLTIEMALFGLIILAAIVTRFYDLGARVMSHDESLHTYFSWLLYKGQGYQHSPMMHGPYQFHLLALSYFLFGVSDFTARIPAALFSIATVWMVWHWRHYLGKTGAILAGVMLVISPYMLFYGRYVRNESYVGFLGVLMLYTILRYLETREQKYLYYTTIALALHFATKETSFIYAAQALLFLAIYFVAQVTRRPWAKSEHYRSFVIALAAGVLLAGLTVGFSILGNRTGTLTGTETAAPLDPTTAPSPLDAPGGSISPLAVLGTASLAGFVVAAIFLVSGYTWKRIRLEPSFDLLMLIGTLVLPQLAPFPVTLAGFNPTDYSLEGMTRTALFLVPIALLSIGIGYWWKGMTWVKNAVLFYGIFTVLYTTVFTNGQGFFTGLVGSLGYWLEQQGVQRGSQPWYYYILVQIPIYEFLPAIASIAAVFLGIFKLNQLRPPAGLLAEATGADEESLETVESGEPARPVAEQPEHVESLEIVGDDDPAQPVVEHPEHTEYENLRNFLGLLIFWIITAVFAYSYAGEKMPWLTVHMAWPMILLGGWALGQIVEQTDWAALFRSRGLLIVVLTVLAILSLGAGFLSALGPNPPFQGKDLVQLQDTSTFLLSAIVAIGSIAGLVYLLKDIAATSIFPNLLSVTFFALLFVLTGRAALRAAYINYDNPKEYLVYAHAARGVKDVVEQAEEISKRTTGGMGVSIAYDASQPDTGVSWPVVWYLRDFTNQQSFDNPTRALRDVSVLIVDAKNFDKIGPVVGDAFYEFEYARMWWPNQDYFNLDWGRIKQALTDPQIRAGIFDIWLNRDYTLYAEATESEYLTLPTWEPTDRMRLYIRKDVAAQIWNYGVGPVNVAEALADPYEGKVLELNADIVVGSWGQELGQFDAPRGIAVAPDGSLYVADSRNNRIVHLDASGDPISAWGTASSGCPYTAAPPADIPVGTFCEPWGIAVGPDGSVYVTDTWNHRVQKFDLEGNAVASWGLYGLGETGDAFWGPRGIVVSEDNRVYVMDTGNKRVAIFDENGQFLSQFGTVGLAPGEFDEPVGIAMGGDGTLYVTDTWNQRIQTFIPLGDDGLSYAPLAQWDVVGWYGQSLDNKPFIAVDEAGQVFVTDPEGYRVIAYSPEGQILYTWGTFGVEPGNFGIAAALAFDADGNLWVTDAGNMRIMRFALTQP